ncbi:MAG: hypothetical protein QNK15_05385 [Cycloclasticus sp.]|nr:hypothetical protein [Cycloclasticus sp.]
MNQCTKELQLLALAKHRQENVYEGYKNISDPAFAEGAYECDYVSPYSKSAHNVNADVFIALQDWSSEDNLKGTICEETNRFGYTPSVGTNKNLVRLLKEHLNLNLKETYTTNLFPFIKPERMSAEIKVKDLRKAALDYTIPMIKIIKPRIVVALGMKTFNAIKKTSGLELDYDMNEAVANPFEVGSAKVFFQAHPSQRSQNKRGATQVSKDWKIMENYLKKENHA